MGSLDTRAKAAAEKVFDERDDVCNLPAMTELARSFSLDEIKRALSLLQFKCEAHDDAHECVTEIGDVLDRIQSGDYASDSVNADIQRALERSNA